LHIDKAMKVSSLCEYKAEECDGSDTGLIGRCKYFETRKYELCSESALELYVNESSFLSVTCISGDGYIEGEKMSRGDSFFVPANSGEIHISGSAEIITVSVPD